MWYTPYHTLTHNALINMIIGPRGCGKSYGLKKYAVNKWIKSGEMFLYVRRYSNELEMVKNTVFNDLQEFNIKCDGDVYVMEESIIGYCMSLSSANKFKSASYPTVTTIIFDEFIIDEKAGERYLKNEIEKFLNLLETVIRTRDNVRVFMLANSISFVNPYTMYWGLEYNGKQFIKTADNLVLVEIYQDEEFTEFKRDTKLGRLIDNSDFGKMAIDNSFINDNYTFIKKRKGNWRYVCGFKLDGINIGFWKWGNLYFFDNKCDMNNVIFVMNEYDHTENTRLDKRPAVLKPVVNALKNNRVSFSSLQVKKIVLKMLRKYI